MLHALAVISPGPDFAIVIKQSVSNGRLIGRITALGIGTAILWHVAYSLIGVGFLANNSDSLFTLMKNTAAAYLIYIGIGAIRTQSHQIYKSDEKSDDKVSLISAFKVGFLTNGLNPKAALFFVSLFTVVVKPTTPIPVQMGYGVYLACATALWFVVVATIFSKERVRREFEKIGHWFDRIMGVLLILLGLNIASSAIN